MTISLNWLKDYLKIDKTKAKEIADAITKSGVAVEAVTPMINCTNLTIGYVIERKPHPNSDHLSICQVDLGDGIKQIVCGAPNVDKDQKVIVAKDGAILQGEYEIKKTVIRGEESNGMICSLQELGVDESNVPVEYRDGIYVLGDDAKVGGCPLEYLGLDDIIYTLDLNPNRYDCLSVLGFAYEAAAVTNEKVTEPDTSFKISKTDEKLKVTVDTKNCTMYLGRIVKDVTIKESPEWLKNRLIALGMRPINNVVDISNYVMLEYGQPLHFFDKEKLGNNILVRMAEENEKVITLDKQERTLTKEDIVITDGKKVVCIAGVMGSINSDVDQNTKDVVIESAIFNPYNTRYTSIRLDLRSEASIRFEKGLDYKKTEAAINRACHLLEKYADATITSAEDRYDKVDKSDRIAKVTLTKINNLLGMNLTIEDVKTQFERLSFPYKIDKETFTVTIPSRRLDVTIEECLVEEIGRLYGYDNIQAKLPCLPAKKGSYNPRTLFQKQISKRMRSLGLDQVRSYNLLSEEENKLFDDNKGESVKLLMPLSSDRSNLRKSILPTMLKTVEYNIDHRIKDISIYEISNVYTKTNDDFQEISKLAIALTGNYIKNTWNNQNIKSDFYTLKGIIENLLDYLGLANRYQFLTDNLNKGIHPGIGVRILVDNDEVGFFGKIHPRISKLDLYLSEINLDKLFDKKTRGIKFKEVSKYPEVNKDIAFIVPKTIDSKEVENAIKKAAGRLLTNITTFDVYTGENVATDEKSIAYALTFSDSTKTLTEEEVNEVFNKIIIDVEKNLNAKVRDK